jgi:hypothetical protein
MLPADVHHGCLPPPLSVPPPPSRHPCVSHTTPRARGFGFLEYRDPRDAEEAMYKMDRTVFMGREISVRLYCVAVVVALRVGLQQWGWGQG